MNRRPTKKAWIVVGIGLLLVLVGTTAQAGWLYVLAAGVLGLAAGSLFVAHRLKGVAIERHVPRRMRVGDDVRVGLQVTNQGRRAVPIFTMDDAFEAFAPAVIASDRIPAGGTVDAELIARVERRGVFEGGPVTLRSGAPFGLIRSRRTFDVTSSTTCVPRWVELSTFPMLAPSPRSERIADQQSRVGSGEEYLGIREYRPGDPQRSVHWRSTARAGRLIVREYNREISSPVSIVLAGTDHGEGGESSFETLVSAVASIGIFALASGHPVNVVRAGTSGSVHLRAPGKHELLDWLARAVAVDADLRPLAEEALVLSGGQGTVVLCTSSSGTAGASLQATARAVSTAGARAVAVASRSRSWNKRADEATIDLPDIRWLEREKGLLSCLA